MIGNIEKESKEKNLSWAKNIGKTRGDGGEG